MSSVKIAKKKQEVLFTLTNGSEIQGEVSLELYSTNRMGAQRIDELLNEGNRFIPVGTKDGFILLNTTHIMLAKAKLVLDDHDLIMLGEKYRVGITTLLNENIEADVFVSLPEGYLRVKDYLNQSIRFFTFFLSEYVLYVNREFILFVRD